MRARKLILLVDGDSERLGLRRMLLENQAHVRVVPCGSAEDALVMLRAGLRAELLVAEWRQTGMDGNELCALAAQIDPLMNRILIDAGGETVPADSWAHRYLGRNSSTRELLEVCRTFVARKRGPRRGAALASATQGAAV